MRISIRKFLWDKKCNFCLKGLVYTHLHICLINNTLKKDIRFLEGKLR